jgi:hypothetical protein
MDSYCEFNKYIVTDWSLIMKKLEKYIYEDDTIYELGEHDVYYYVFRPKYHEKAQSSNYAKTRFNFLLEHPF